MKGRVAGIARHAVALGPIETVDSAELVLGHGLAGDFRGQHKPGTGGRRGVSLIEAGDWAAAIAEVGANLPWYERRANLLVEDFDLPQMEGVRLRVGETVLEVSCECEPCERMEKLAPGLRKALGPDWRGGVLAKVLQPGRINVGDAIRIED